MAVASLWFVSSRKQLDLWKFKFGNWNSMGIGLDSTWVQTHSIGDSIKKTREFNQVKKQFSNKVKNHIWWAEVPSHILTWALLAFIFDSSFIILFQTSTELNVDDNAMMVYARVSTYNDVIRVRRINIIIVRWENSSRYNIFCFLTNISSAQLA